MEVAALGAVVIGLAVYAAFAVVRHYDLANPYRDGTTHRAVLSFEFESGDPTMSPCLQWWSASLGAYTWHPAETPPWGEKTVQGTLHIISSQRLSTRSPGNPVPAATFTGRGHTIDLMGGRHPRGTSFSSLNCSISSVSGP